MLETNEQALKSRFEHVPKKQDEIMPPLEEYPNIHSGNSQP